MASPNSLQGVSAWTHTATEGTGTREGIHLAVRFASCCFQWYLYSVPPPSPPDLPSAQHGKGCKRIWLSLSPAAA